MLPASDITVYRDAARFAVTMRLFGIALADGITPRR